MPDVEPLQLSDGWRVAGPKEAYMDERALSDLTHLVEIGEFPNTHAVLIEHAGHLVYETYYEGEDYADLEFLGHVVFEVDTLHDLQSVTKSVTALLLGLALGSDFDEVLATPIAKFFPDLDIVFGAGTDAVTLQHVLTMTAGIQWGQRTDPWDEGNDGYLLFETDTPIEMVLGRPVINTPGTKWVYNSGLTEIVGGIVARLTRQRLDKFAESALFEPLGITHYEWWGSQNWQPVGMPSASSGLRLRARDVAKIGSLVLHGGAWNNKQVIPVAWIDVATRPHVNGMKLVHYGIFNYGFQWYTGVSSSIPAYPIVWAFGYGGQCLYVLPDQHLVVTVLAGNYGGPYEDNGARMLGRIVRAHIDHL